MNTYGKLIEPLFDIMKKTVANKNISSKPSTPIIKSNNTNNDIWGYGPFSSELSRSLETIGAIDKPIAIQTSPKKQSPAQVTGTSTTGTPTTRKTSEHVSKTPNKYFIPVIKIDETEREGEEAKKLREDRELQKQLDEHEKMLKRQEKQEVYYINIYL